jgi:hypothetical protein
MCGSVNRKFELSYLGEFSRKIPRQGNCIPVLLCTTTFVVTFLLQLNKTPSSSKKVTFGLNRNMTTGESGMLLGDCPQEHSPVRAASGSHGS